MVEARVKEWLSPTILLLLLGVVGTAYAAFWVQRERIERLEARMAQVEADFVRKEVSREQLAAIIQRLDDLTQAVREGK